MRQILAQERFDPKILIGQFKTDPELAVLFDSRVGVSLPFTLEAHTLAAMGEFEKYFAGRMSGEREWERGILRAALALHDIGKPAAILRGDKRLQHYHTLDLLHALKHRWDFVREELHLLAALLAGDPIGSYLTGRQELEASVEEIRHHGAKSLQPPSVYWRMLVTYYQCDAAAYSSSAGILAALDSVFEWSGESGVRSICWDEARSRLQFSAEVSKRFENLETVCLEPQQ